jgi:hypothetical protein
MVALESAPEDAETPFSPELWICIFHQLDSSFLLKTTRLVSRQFDSLVASVLRWRLSASIARRSFNLELVCSFRYWVGDEDRFYGITYSVKLLEGDGIHARVVMEPAFQRLLRCTEVTQSTFAMWLRGKSQPVVSAGQLETGSRRPREPKDIYGTSAIYGSAFTFDPADYTAPLAHISSFDIAEVKPVIGLPGFTVPIRDSVWLGLRISGLIDASQDDYVLAPDRTPTLVCPALPPLPPQKEPTQLPAFLELRPGFGRYISATAPIGSSSPEIVLEHSVAPAKRTRGSPLQDRNHGAPIGSRLAQFVPGRLEMDAAVLVARGCSIQRKEKKVGRGARVDVVARTLGCTRMD